MPILLFLEGFLNNKISQSPSNEAGRQIHDEVCIRYANTAETIVELVLVAINNKYCTQHRNSAHALFFPSYRFLPNNYGRPLPTQLCPQSPLLLVYLSYHADQMILSNSIAPGTDMTSAISPLPYTLTLSDVHDNLNHYAVAYAGHSTPSTSLMVAF